MPTTMLMARMLETVFCIFDGVTLEEVEDHPVVDEFQEEAIRRPWYRDYPNAKESVVFHMGRIRFFVEELRTYNALTPVEVDNPTDGVFIYPKPILVDGHHRFWATKLLGRKTIQASYGGRLDVLRFLQGKRKNLPL